MTDDALKRMANLTGELLDVIGKSLQLVIESNERNNEALRALLDSFTVLKRYE